MRQSICFIVWLAFVAATSAAGQSDVTEAESSVRELESSVRDLIHAARSTAKRNEKELAFAAAVPEAERLLAARQDARSFELLTTALMGARRFEDARRVSESWSESFPDDWTAHFFLGQSFYVERDFESALPILERAFELAPGHRNRQSVARGLGFVLEHLKRFEDAIAVYEEVGLTDSANRVRANLKTLGRSDGPEGSTSGMEDEERRLEQELEALEREDP